MRKGICRSLALAALIALSTLAPLHARAQGEDEFVQELMARMSVEDKIGQLFLVTFVGNDVGPESDIAQLIQEYRVGGVVLLAKNGNFTNGEDTPRQVAELTNALQALAFSPRTTTITETQQVTATTPITVAFPAANIPLFIATVHEGDGFPYTQIIGGMTEVPSQMALGATWNVENAERIGEVVGRELAALGINLLLGPSLDVLDNPRPGLKGDLGTRCFGGDPYWVGRFGQAYIGGVHKGSGGRVATVAKHFPGRGGSDRRTDEEVATVQKSLQELRKIELAPFFAVTQPAEGEATTDALMTSHIRYRGFQGNIRQLTRPISFDPQALQALMALPEFEPWRKARGVMVTDSLGVPAVRKYYDPQLTTFPHKRIAQEAFLAGNDLLLLSQFALGDSWPEQLENIKSTIQFFRDKYVSDPAFQARVDEALGRILRLKHRLYPEFSLEAVQVDVGEAEKVVGQGREEVFQAAQEAITLIYPGPEELADRLPSPPFADERILIFTDDRQARDCPTCEPYPFIETEALERTILQLYGPEGSGQVNPANIESLTFTQLKDFLAGKAGPSVEALIERADWIVFAMLDFNPEDYPMSDAVKSFLRERSDILRGKKVVALAYSAPYYLDTTEISKLTAYYGVYSKVQPFIEASVRALFRELPPQGAPPVTVEGINYKLITQLEPDPAQLIRVMLPGMPAGEGTPTPLDVDVGDTLRVRTGVIVDKNGHPVPDGTPVTFRLFYPAEGIELPPHHVTTVDGVAETIITLERAGELEITASSDPARTSTTLKVIIKGGEPATIATEVPTPTVTPTPTPTATPTPTPPPSPTPTPTLEPTSAPTPAERPPEEPPQPSKPVRRRVDGADFLLSLAGASLIGGLGYLMQRNQGRPLSQGLRLFLLSLVWGLVGYNLYGLGAPGTGLFRRLSERWGATLICLAFSLGCLLWQAWRARQRPLIPEG